MYIELYDHIDARHTMNEFFFANEEKKNMVLVMVRRCMPVCVSILLLFCKATPTTMTTTITPTTTAQTK
jgi:hypothetical protein